MSNNKWTEDQRKVIDIRNCNVLVSAAAGSGKTAVLVERIIAMVMGADGNEPVDIDNLLVVTFTRAAAGEMRERILAAIEKEAMEDPLNEHLRKQLTYIHNARITTIDSFCADVVRENFSQIDLDPAFKVGDVGELTLLKSDVLAEVLEENYLKGDREFLNFVDIYSGSKSDSQLEELIFKLYDFAQSYPNPEKWLDSLVDAYSEEFVTKWIDLVVNQLKNQINEIYVSVGKALSICDTYSFDKIENVLLEEYEVLKKLVTLNEFEEIGRELKAFSFGRLPAMRGLSEEDEAAKKQVQNIRDGYKKVIKKLIEKYFQRSYEDILYDIVACKPIVETLVRLTKEFSNGYREVKADKDLVDFNDLEHFALQILVKEDEAGNYIPTDTARVMASDIYEVMIDEYQDSNLVQEIILNAVSGRGKDESNVFMVGDVKQSIYKFRLARPELFLGKYEEYDSVESEESSHNLISHKASNSGSKILLTKNFRSRRQVLEFCNLVFEQCMTRELGGITYDEASMLYTGFEYPDDSNERYRTEILFVDTNDKKNTDNKKDSEAEDDESLSKIELEASVVADKIKLLVNGDNNAPLKVYDKSSGGLREVRYSDIAILFRSTTGYADAYTEVLMSKGIPVYTNLAEGYFNTFEIGAILDLLSVIDNPRQDIKLAGVLRNIFRLTENMLSDIRISSEGSFYDAFANYNGIYGDCVIDIREKLSKYRDMVSYTSIYDLICYVIDDTHFKQFIMSGGVGEKRIANVEMLLEKAKVYENGPYNGLFNFIRFIEKLEKYKVEQGEATVVDEDDNSVKIMTIHKSKGLEFPVVFVGGMGKKMNMRDTTEKLVIHHELGIGIDRIDTDKRIRYKSLVKEAIGNRIRHENFAEELRVLYVALTRAREKLILVGTGNVQSKLEKEININSYMDWIIMSTVKSEYKIARTFSMPLENHYEFKVISPEDIFYKRFKDAASYEQVRKALTNWDKDKVYNGELRNKLYNMFDYTYEHEESCKIRSKMSISDIKHMFMKMSIDEEREEVVLDFSHFTDNEVWEECEKKKPVSTIDSAEGAMRGTAYHRVLELFDYDMEISRDEDIDKMIEVMVASGLIDGKSRTLVNSSKIKAFAESDLGKRMKLAHKNGKLYREKPFVMGIKACDIDREKYTSEELVVVQGIVDAWFIEGDEIVLVDYKTDSVKKLEDLVARYESQLVYYGQALERITGKRVKSRIIYSVKFEQSIEV